MTVRVITPPACEPLSLAEAKEHLRLDDSLGSYQDALIGALITTCREYAENYTRRAFIQQTLEYSTDCFSYELELPRPNLLSLESIKYVDLDGTLQTVDASLYQVDAARAPARVKPAYLQSWPALVRSSDYNAVRVRYVAGYAPVGSPVDDAALRAGVPEVVKQWMKIQLANYHMNPTDIITGTISSKLDRTFHDALLDSIVVRLF
jgi:uncharacterized phiE125 gp8 family phage protein